MTQQIIYPKYPILLVDDEPNFLCTASFILKSHRITNIVTCKESNEVMPLLSQKKYSIILLANTGRE